jgi:hypothetical protein
MDIPDSNRAPNEAALNLPGMLTGKHPHLKRTVIMPQIPDANTWVYTVITNPGSDEQVLGQLDAEAEISYIPIFMEKEDANQGILNLEVARGTRCEVQAVLYDEIARAADKNGFLVYLLDASGNILEKIAPTVPKS